MTKSFNKILFHLALMAGINSLLILIMIYPFLPGDYDSLAMALSTIVQAFGAFGLLLVPVGLLWLMYEISKQNRTKRNLAIKSKRYFYALASLIVSSLIVALLYLVALALIGFSLCLLLLALWIYTVVSLIPGLRLMKKEEHASFDFMPLYLICVPIAVLSTQLILAAPLTEFSRNHAITQSGEIIQDIEAYHAQYGHYPAFLIGNWKDYYPNVVGIEKYHYTLKGNAYNLIFEQPRFLLNQIGTREFVVYNKMDEHFVISHTAWLLLSPGEVGRAQGWYTSHDTSIPHWKYLWFD